MAEQSQMQNSVPKAARPVAHRSASDALTSKDVLSILRQHVWLIILFTFAGLIIGSLSWFLFLRFLPKYAAVAYIEVLSPVEKDPLTIGQYTINRENQFVFRVSLASLITQQGMLERFLADRDNVRQTNWFKNLGGGAERTGRSIERGLKDLKKHLGASVDRDSDFIRVSMVCSDPCESALIANEMTNLFLMSRESTEKQSAREQLALLGNQRDDVQNSINDFYKQMNAIRIQTGFYDLEEHSYQDVFTQRVAVIEIENTSILLEISNTQAQIVALERQASGPIEEQVTRAVESSDNVTILLNQQAALLGSELASFRSKYGQNHRIVRQAQQRLDEINNKKQARAVEIGDIFRKANLRDSQDALAILSGRLKQLDLDRGNAEKQKRNIDEAKARYEEIKQKKDEAQTRILDLKAAIEKYNIIVNSPETPKVRLAARAVRPLEVSFPRWPLFMLGGTILGLLLGVALAFALEMLNDLVRTPRDISRFLRIPQLGVIPDSDEDELLENIEPSLALIRSPYSVVAEAYRNMRSNVRLLLSPNSKSILVTSPFAGEGKTSVAVNLSASLAAQGAKVLLIDANFWKPKLDVLFPPAQQQRQAPKKKIEAEVETQEQNGLIEIGLSTVLAGLCGYHEVIRPSGIANCDIVDSGELATNPGELLGSEQMAQFIKHQCEIYNYVIIDGPPALLVGDVKQLAKIVDDTILVFNAAGTKRGAAQRIISDLFQVNAVVLGCVLFSVRYIKGGYFREQFRAYQDYQKAQFAKAAAS